jgi:hypothetical protein
MTVTAIQIVSCGITPIAIHFRVIFGFSYTSAPVLIDFLRRHRSEIRHLTGVRDLLADVVEPEPSTAHHGALNHLVPFEPLCDESIAV